MLQQHHLYNSHDGFYIEKGFARIFKQNVLLPFCFYQFKKIPTNEEK